MGKKDRFAGRIPSCTDYTAIESNVKVAKIFDDSHHNHQHGNHNEGLECLRQWRLEEVSRNIADHQRKGQINPAAITAQTISRVKILR